MTVWGHAKRGPFAIRPKNTDCGNNIVSELWEMAACVNARRNSRVSEYTLKSVLKRQEGKGEMNTTTRKFIGVVAAAVLAGSLIALAGCSSSGSGSAASASASSASASAASQSASASSAAASSQASASSAAASSQSASSEAASSQSAGIANPWSDAVNAEEAAKGAGIDSFALPEGAIADLGEPFAITYRYMDGMAEARYEFPASAVTVRTAKIADGDSFDISGDYNTYEYEWTETIANAPIACAGNREGESTKTYWGEGNVAHSLVAEGLGGDESFGLNTERLTVFVEAMN